MPMPFSHLELRARIRACLRRTRGWRLPRRLVAGASVVDRDARKAFHAGRELRLSRLEFDLLAHPAAWGGTARVVSRRDTDR
jgi:DNA-binding response OmpR family regulator